MQRAFAAVLVILALAATSVAGDLPDAPSRAAATDPAAEFLVPVSRAPVNRPIGKETKVVDNKFLALAIISTGMTFSDSYTTLFARQNWLAGKTNVCNTEVQSPYLYGSHPTAPRVYAVASVKSVASIAASYYLRRHRNKFWSLPLIANAVIGLQGTTQNMLACN